MSGISNRPHAPSPRGEGVRCLPTNATPTQPSPIKGEGFRGSAAMSGVSSKRAPSPSRVGVGELDVWSVPSGATPTHGQVRVAPRPEAMSGGHGDLPISPIEGEGFRGSAAMNRASTDQTLPLPGGERVAVKGLGLWSDLAQATPTQPSPIEGEGFRAAAASVAGAVAR
jgi:hypothetical protein